MAAFEDAFWTAGGETGLPSRDRRSGPYRTYRPDPLGGRPLVVDPVVSRRISEVERSIRRIAGGTTGVDLEGLSRFLLRSEAVASSFIEGIAPSSANVAVAELAQTEDVQRVGDQAQLVARNITIVARATEELVALDEVTVDDVVRLQSSLIHEERHHGVRVVQNWIGGSNWHPLEAQFVPPPPDHVDGLMADLLDYVNGSHHAPLVQAALVHGQFETIHPFTDGNGRVGRALIHTVLARRGLTRQAVLPISLVLSTLREEYVGGLTSYRFEGLPDAQAALSGTQRWIQTFVEAAAVAVQQASELATAVGDLRTEWDERLARHRAGRGVREVPRSGSATARLLALLPEAPVVTARTVERVLGVSYPAANAAVQDLAEAGILRARQLNRGTTGYLATEVLDLVDLTERQLASTAFDTRTSPPNRPVPARRQF
ncbi:Fic family protein [Kineococcus sp. NPDC059986]|uniref:Fic family protein n=1 Tax=Kineococcus sp. NPDC059986 TaxID=3155538 RepID=UPI00344DF10F